MTRRIRGPVFWSAIFTVVCLAGFVQAQTINYFAGGAGNTTAGGNDNVGIGTFALSAITAGSYNSAFGAFALQFNTSANYNVGVGIQALNLTGGPGAQFNTAIGAGAGLSNGTGAGNTAVGGNALYGQTSGNYNVAVGYAAGGVVAYNDPSNAFSDNTTIGAFSGTGLTSGSSNVLIGYNAGYNLTTGSANILIGNGVPASSASSVNFLNIGNAIYGNLSNGYIGIGTANPQSALAVQGTITTQEVVVTNTGWPDFVFTPSYRLKPLSEVAAYVKEKGHLPEIPSAQEVQEKGVSLGEMQSKPLAKIEELTLHMIEADKEIQNLNRRNQTLEEKIARLTQ